MKMGLINARWLAVLAGAVICCAGLPAWAQDSVGGVLGSRCGGTSGLDCNDGQSSYDASTEQAFVVDLGTRWSSWGNYYGFAPIMKGSRSDTGFFTNQISAQASSMAMSTDGSFRNAAYGLWNAQGQGVDNPGSVEPAPMDGLFRFGAGFTDFGGDSNNILSGVGEVSPTNLNRLYFTRYESAVNRATSVDGDNAQIGLGGVDGHGNIAFRADDYALAGLAPITGNNWIFVDNTARTAGMLNVLQGAGPNTSTDAAATNYLVNGSTVTHNTPTVIDGPLVPTPVVGAGNFNAEYGYGLSTAAGVTYTMAHRTGTTNQRGNAAFTHTYTAFGPGSVGTMAQYAQVAVGVTDSIVLWGVDATGAVTGNKIIPFPTAGAPITDPKTGWSSSSEIGVTNNGVVYGHESQTAYRGGNGQVAIAGDRNDPNILHIAVPIAYTGFGVNGTQDDPFTYIAVGRYDIVADTTTWVVAAYNSQNDFGSCTEQLTGTGKAVLDGPGGSVIGRLLPLDLVTGGVPVGPSMSAPMLNQDGDVFFVASFVGYKDDGLGGCFADTDSGLFKANLDPADGGYELERIIELGSTVYGRNSDTRWQLSFMGVADTNSISSGTAFSSNIIQDVIPFTPVLPQVIPPVAPGDGNDYSFDAFDMGGLVVNMAITYDVDTDGLYENPSSTPGSADESYNVLMYVRGYVRTGACCIGASCEDMTEADCNTNGGTFNGQGSVCEFTTCAATCPPADVDCSGTPDAGDILIVRGGANWNQSPPATARADVDGSGTADAGDILVIRGGANWNVSFSPCVCP